MQQRFRFDPIDKAELAHWMNFSNGGRIQAMLNARQLAFGLIRGQLRLLYPAIDDRELTLKLFEELEIRAKRRIPNFSLFLDILHTLERINAPYMVIGAFVSLMYGSTRNTFDIDIIVDLNWAHIQQLVAAYPPPGFVEPKRGFGWLWRTHLGRENGSLGWALDKAYGFNNVAQSQEFEHGVMFKGSDPKVYVLLYNGTFLAAR